MDSTNKTPAMGMPEPFLSAAGDNSMSGTLFLEMNYLIAKNLLLFV
jgi:hypothetical protein